MKLYTEEQVREMLSMTDMIFDNDLMPHKDIISCFKPIELPSDEEILNLIGDGRQDFYKGSFEEGAKWMRDKIKQKQLIIEIMQADEKDGLYENNQNK